MSTFNSYSGEIEPDPELQPKILELGSELERCEVTSGLLADANWSLGLPSKLVELIEDIRRRGATREDFEFLAKREHQPLILHLLFAMSVVLVGFVLDHGFVILVGAITLLGGFVIKRFNRPGGLSERTVDELLRLSRSHLFTNREYLFKTSIGPDRARRTPFAIADRVRQFQIPETQPGETCGFSVAFPKMTSLLFDRLPAETIVFHPDVPDHLLRRQSSVDVVSRVSNIIWSDHWERFSRGDPEGLARIEAYAAKHFSYTAMPGVYISPQAMRSHCSDAVVAMVTDLNVVSEACPWQNIIEFRRDKGSVLALKRFVNFIDGLLAVDGLTRENAAEVLAKLESDYRTALKKFSITTTTLVGSTVLQALRLGAVVDRVAVLAELEQPLRIALSGSATAIELARRAGPAAKSIRSEKARVDSRFENARTLIRLRELNSTRSME